ncbi:MAG: hypothetical protein U0441_17785 [Polyangiaceae bacterium]
MALVALATACSATDRASGTGGDGGSGTGGSGAGTTGGSAGTTGTGAGGGTGGSGGKVDCSDPLDQTGCTCDTPGDTRACYTGPAGTDGKGICKDGAQTCVLSGEFATWGPCAGDTLPTDEDCSDQLDHNCNGLTGCDDSACVGLPGCCTPGDTRSCYDGPPGSQGKGACHDGSQTCTLQGSWGPCMGEGLPGDEGGHCTDGLDNDCDGQIDCAQFVCLIFDPACQPMQCTPGATQPCYDGPAGTEGVGPCKGGTKTCKADGSGWGPCTGEVLPVGENSQCGDNLDNDCNGLIDCTDPLCAGAATCCIPVGNPADGTIYANSPSTLYKVDPSTFAVTTVGNFNAGDQMTDVAVTPSGELYGISFTTLYKINKMTAAATMIADVPGSGNNSLTFLPDGKLLASDSNGDLKIINPANGQVTFVGNYQNSLLSAGDLIAVANGTMYGSSPTKPGGGDASSSNELIVVNTSTGVATAVGQTGYADVWGLAYAGGKVIGFTTAGQILQIDPVSGAATVLATKNIAFWGAGQSPLVEGNPCN